MLSKLEQKLPYLVRRDWIIKVSDESFDSKTPTEISEEFLSFLKKTKKQVEYDNSEGRSGGQHGKGWRKGRERGDPYWDKKWGYGVGEWKDETGN